MQYQEEYNYPSTISQFVAKLQAIGIVHCYLNLLSTTFTERLLSKQKNTCITFVQLRPNVFDIGPALYKWYTKALRLLVSSAPFYAG